MPPTAPLPPGLPVRPWSHRLPPPVVMMGVPFDQVTTPQALEIMGEMIASGRPHLLATANVDFLAQVQEDVNLRNFLVACDLVVCDGTPLVWMSRLLGDPLPERVAGSDLVPLLLDLAAKEGHRVYFLGGRDEVLVEARKRIAERWPALQIAGMYSPPFAPVDGMDNAEICRRIREARADILLVSFGCPKQEKWLALNYEAAGVPVAVGVGATIDFLAGTMKRAPKWMSRCGLEWVFRAGQEPKRLVRRYCKDIRIVGPGLIRQLCTMRRRRPGTAGPLPVCPQIPEGPPAGMPEVTRYLPIPGSATGPVRMGADHIILTLPERLDASSARDASLWTAVESNGSPYIIADASRTEFLDSTGTGKLVRLARLAKERGGCIILAGATTAVTGPLALMKLASYFQTAPDLATALARLPVAV